ncbi:MAG: TRAP transporter substrate-binding protein [Deltaproteobacteria bacterium]|jgi:TRAP-type transport system periplasmic protein|nr:TRAP transporter substrate-binding protein [Deltaproteobacteria bacterium]
MKKRIFWTTAAVSLCFMAFAFLTPAMAEKPIKLRMSSFVPPMHFMNTKILQPWIDMIEERTKGKVKIKIYAGSALGKPQDQYDMAARGVADITWGILAYTPGRFPLVTVMELPFMSPNAEIGSRMVQRLYEKGVFEGEFKDVKMLALGMPPNMDLHTSKKLVKNLADLKGMKIRTPSAMMGKLIKKWGGVPVAMPAPEVYMSLERGVIDAIFLDPLTLMGIKCNEVTKYHTRVGISTTVFFFAMNQKVWDKLPPDAQKVITELSGEYLGAEMNGKMADRAVMGVYKKLKASGDEIYTLPPTELAVWEKSAQPAFGEWVKAMEGKGLPGKKVLEEALQMKKACSKKK